MSNLLRSARKHLFAEKVNGKTYFVNGLLPDKPDERDFVVGWSLFGYAPQKQAHIIKTFSTKDQNYNTCVQEEAALVAEVREGMELSEQSLTILAKEAGAIYEDGFSSLRGIMDVLRTKGIAEKRFANESDHAMSFEDYTKHTKLSFDGRRNAEVHKIKNYVYVSGRSALLKALDENIPMVSGFEWYSGFNMRNGFQYPWVIEKNTGYLIGGHGTALIGYVFNYKGIDSNQQLILGAGGKNVYVFKNSYGTGWGATVVLDGVKHEGLFFVEMNFGESAMYRPIQQIDLDNAQYAELVTALEGKDVKGKKSAIYRIQDGEKRPYQSKLDFYIFGGRFGSDGKTYQDVAQSLLDQIPEGKPMNPVDSPHWSVVEKNIELIQVMAEPDNLTAIKKIITQQAATERYYAGGVTSQPMSKLIWKALKSKSVWSGLIKIITGISLIATGEQTVSQQVPEMLLTIWGLIDIYIRFQTSQAIEEK